MHGGLKTFRPFPSPDLTTITRSGCWLQVWGLLMLFNRRSGSVFPMRSIHTEISPLRYAPVEMTKGRAVVARNRFYGRSTAFCSGKSLDDPPTMKV